MTIANPTIPVGTDVATPNGTGTVVRVDPDLYTTPADMIPVASVNWNGVRFFFADELAALL